MCLAVNASPNTQSIFQQSDSKPYSAAEGCGVTLRTSVNELVEHDGFTEGGVRLAEHNTTFAAVGGKQHVAAITVIIVLQLPSFNYVVVCRCGRDNVDCC
eukprot:TRINITY_DN15434_c0_g1_i1.p1 TRINITY_DN15434_c0_g1~~TRINITY_DN15434_c0_g1_i1.p1  ORF type:complete len:100 (+),score=7.75 TRINITY_DN15434_c0_g1_i1:2131-2430(+)